MINIDIYEYLIFFFWLFVMGTFLYFYSTVWKNELSRYLFPGFLLKVLGGFAFVMVYNYYYNSGDTTYYYQGAAQLADILTENPVFYFQLLGMDHAEAQQLLYQKGIFILFAQAPEEWFMLKLSSPFAFLGFQTFLGTTLFLSLISMLGSWYLFSTMHQILPGKSRFLFMINFLFPTVLFWGSGIMKDTVTLACFSIGVALFYRLLYFQGSLFWRSIWMLLLFYLIYQLKAYITIAFLVWVLITGFLISYKRIQSLFLRLISIPFLLGTFALLGYLGFANIAEQSKKYNTDRVLTQMEGFHSWHKQLGGSAYDLHINDYTIGGLLAKFPQGVNVTLFRPYIWETHNAFMLLNALESLFLLVFTLWVLLRCGKHFFQILRQNPYLLGGLFFVLFFAYAIGISSYNFGALVRFKIPLLALYLFILYYIYQIHKNKESETIKSIDQL